MTKIYTSKQIQETVNTINTKIHWYGFPNLETKPNSYHSSLVKILCAIDYDYTYPLLVYLLNTRIIDLENLKHTDIEYLNKVGITIYLNEPLSLYSEINDDTLKATELDSILIYMENNGLNNVTVHTCDYRCEELLPYYTSRMKLVTDDIFLKTINATRATIPQDNFTKKFINLNWRYTDHRHLVAGFVSTLSSNCSWKYTVDDSVLGIYDWANIKELDDVTDNRLSTGLKYLYENAPIELDIVSDKSLVNGITNIHQIKNDPIFLRKQSIERFYADSFCDIVTETKYAQQTGNISEKTLKPIGYRKPFILVAPPFCLEYLRSMGYKTFSDFWDESYDTETDHQQRMIKIFKLIDSINNKTIDELKTLYKEMLPIIDHNATVLNEKLPYVSTTEKIRSVNSQLRNTIWKYRTER